MSDPVANVDIEDVLSSIRRLVSNGSEKDGGTSRTKPEDERLVLTPSQRVDESDPAPADECVPTEGATVGAVGVTEAHPPEIDPAPVPGSDRGGDGPADIAGKEHGEEQGDEHGDAETGAGPSPETEDEATLVPLSPELPDVEGDAGPDTPGPVGSKSARGTGAADQTGSDAEIDAGDAEEDPALEGIAAMFARHESAAPSAWEPDGDDEDAFADGASSPALDWRDLDATVEADGDAPDMAGTDHGGGRGTDDQRRAPLRDQDAGAHPDQENAFAVDDEAVLDEAALRDLVAEIVREELMGTLGERITRNVRKLVRREIHRALNSQDFD
ncbi:hypothetical protein [Roseovarius ramblicola]|uniref:Glycerol-3-phosphate dehydrogenase n=1 Tax=Roseovarius ramblicola TaxID=2022336 RepID=A0ABV5HYU5_9RHOB